ncbi:MAG: tetratricopeptide repeat protein [Planctomycetes bacterium]|nr:tetratricopeptide repeat protein [Planctomycetota bacterium]
MKGIVVVPVGLLLLAATACSSIGHRIERLGPESLQDGYRILHPSVPLPRGQVTGSCGPEAFAAVFAYYRQPVSVQELEQAIYIPELVGTDSTAIPDLVRKRGLAVELTRGGGVPRIREAIQRGAPAVAMVTRGGQYHFFVIVGYNDRTREVVCEDYENRQLLIPYETLEELWKPTQYWCAIVLSAEVETRLHQGYEFELNGQYRQAIEVYEGVVKDHPDCGRAWAALGDCWNFLGQSQRAETCYRGALERQPGQARALIGLGEGFLFQGDPQRALEHFERALASAPDHPRAMNDVAHTLLELRLQPDRAERLAAEAVRGMRERVAELEREASRHIPGKNLLIRRELRDAHWSLSFFLGTLGAAREANGKMEAAVAAWQASADLLPEDEYDHRARRHLQMGACWQKAGQDGKAREQWDLGLKIAADDTLRAELKKRLEAR